jgi:predicted extracellular nuclease
MVEGMRLGLFVVWLATLASAAVALEARVAPTVLRSIEAIQGPGHRSPHEGELVSTIGVVTAVDTNGFYLESPAVDEDPATSSGIFVFTGSAPAVFVGDEIQVSGRVTEFVSGGDAEHLSVTEIVDPTLDALFGEGVPLPVATVVGEGGRVPPSEVIDDDGLAVFDPDRDGIDFYESLEGMRVRLPEPVAVGPLLAFNEFWVVVDSGRGATGRSQRESLVLREGDANPERIQVQLDAGLLPGAPSPERVGDRLGDVVGVVTYGFGNFEVRPTEPSTPWRARSSPVSGRRISWLSRRCRTTTDRRTPATSMRAVPGARSSPPSRAPAVRPTPSSTGPRKTVGTAGSPAVTSASATSTTRPA